MIKKSQIKPSLPWTVKLAAAARRLKIEAVQRRAAETALKKCHATHDQLLADARRAQQQTKSLSHQILLAQEEERKQISRELHDEIAQTLAGINVYLATLKKEAALNTKGLDRTILRTQRLVEKSVNIVHRFASELRPMVLDDLGLIPALHSFVKSFSKRTRLVVHLKVFEGVEQLDSHQRTVLYRVAQEALTNVARHAQARRVDVSIQKLPGGTGLTIQDDGKSFHVERVLHGRTGKRLGLLGMRERVEMVAGTFCIESTPGKGTLIKVEIPFASQKNGAVNGAKNGVLKKSGNHSTLQCP